jgi:hypothetical protein
LRGTAVPPRGILGMSDATTTWKCRGLGF